MDINTTEFNDLVKLGVDCAKGTVTKYSLDDGNKAFRNALIAMNGGKTTLGLKSFRDNKELFALIERVIDQTVPSGLTKNDFFNEWVEERNVGEGDAEKFLIEVESNFVVADISRGNQGIRRQRIEAGKEITLTPTARGIRVYDELTRVLSGRVDISKLTSDVIKAVSKKRLDDVYAAWKGLTVGEGRNFIYESGSFSKDTLHDICARVCASNETDKAIILGTKNAVRKAEPTQIGEKSKDDYNSNGYFTVWDGYKMMAVPQRFKAGTTDFAFDDKTLYIMPVSMDKPIKQTTTGEGMLIVDPEGQNSDLTLNITYITAWATAIITGNVFGVYNFA